jgi:LPXTG-motif cell wall-anchored protein
MTDPTSPGPTPDPAVVSPPVDPPPVEEQRAELAETVDALAQKFDVPTRVKSAAADTAHTAQIKAKDNQQVLVASGAAGVLLLGLFVIIRRRRSKKGTK